MTRFCNIITRNLSLRYRSRSLKEEPSVGRVTYLEILSNPRLRKSHFQ